MTKTEAGIFGYKYEVEKIKRLHLFLYIFAFICTRWKIFTSTYSPKVFNDLYTTSTKFKFFERELETVNKSISKTVETFVMFLYLRNGKYVNNFI